MIINEKFLNWLVEKKKIVKWKYVDDNKNFMFLTFEETWYYPSYQTLIGYFIEFIYYYIPKYRLEVIFKDMATLLNERGLEYMYDYIARVVNNIC